MKYAFSTVYSIVAFAAAFLGCTRHKLDHNLKADKPIHLQLDHNATLPTDVEADLSDLFGDEDANSNKGN